MLNRIFFFLAFSLPLGAFAQTQFSILDIPVCWNDSSIIKYTYVTASGAYLDLGYYSPGGQPVTVSGGTLKTGFCATPAPTSDTLSIDSAGRSFTISLGDQDVSFNAGAEYLAQLLDVDTAGLDSNYILKYSPTAGEWLVFDNNIDGLTDGFFDGFNLFLGLDSINLTSGNFNTSGGRNSGLSITTGSENTNFGAGSGGTIKSGNRNTNLGRSAGGFIETGSHNTNAGAYAGIFNKTGSGNTNLGIEAAAQDTTGSFNTNLGAFTSSAAAFGRDYEDVGFLNFDSILVAGYLARTKDTISTNEIVFGAFTIGNGSNSATLGNANIDSTFLRGDIHFTDYGTGNKTASAISKTRSAYLAAYATDGTLIEVDTSAISPGGITQITAFNGLTDVGADSVKLGGVLTENTTVTGNNARSLEFTGLTTFGAGVIPSTGSFQVGTPTNYVTGNDASGVEVYATKSWIKTPEFLLGNAVDTSLAFFNGALNLSMYGNGDNTGTLTYLAGFNSNGDLIEIDTAGFFPGGGGGGGFTLPTDSITFNDNTGAAVAGKLQRDDNTGTLVYGSPTGTELRLQPPGWYVKNQSGATIPRGTVVRAAGTVGNSDQILIDKMIADGSIEGKFLLGVTAENIADGADGWVFSQGKIKPVDLSAYNSGEVLYVSTTVPGAFTDTLPTAPDLVLPLGFVVDSTSNGTLAVRVTFNPTVTATNGLTATPGADNTQVKLGGDLTEATKIDGTHTYGLWLDSLSFLNAYARGDIRLRADSTTFGTNSALTFDDFTGASLTNFGSTNQYLSSLNLLRSGELSLKQARNFGGVNRESGFRINAADATAEFFSEDKDTPAVLTRLRLQPDKVNLVTPNVANSGAASGMFLKLIDAATGEIDFDTIPNGGGGITSINATNGLTAFNSNGVKLGGTLTENTTINAGTKVFKIVDGGNTNFIALAPGSFTQVKGVFTQYGGNVLFEDYGEGKKGIDSLGLTASPYFAGYATDGTLIERAEVDGSITNEGDLSASSLVAGSLAAITSNTGGGSTVRVQAGGGISVGSPNDSTITVTNASPEATTVGDGLTLTGTQVKLGGTFANDIEVAGSTNKFRVFGGTGVGFEANGSYLDLGYSQFERSTLYAFNQLRLFGKNITIGRGLGNDITLDSAGTFTLLRYGEGIKQAANFPAETVSPYFAGFTTDGTLIERAEVDGSITNEGALSVDVVTPNNVVSLTSNTNGSPSILFQAGSGITINENNPEIITIAAVGENITATNGLTRNIDTLKLGGTLTESTIIDASNQSLNIRLLGTTGQLKFGQNSDNYLLISNIQNNVYLKGVTQFGNYGLGNSEASDLSKTRSNYKAAFANDGTLLEYDDQDAMVIACSDETTALTGGRKVTFRAPYNMEIYEVRASLTTASSSGVVTVDINRGGSSMLDTKLTIDQGETTSTTAAIAPVLNPNKSLTSDIEVTIDIDTPGASAAGLKVTILYRK